MTSLPHVLTGASAPALLRKELASAVRLLVSRLWHTRLTVGPVSDGWRREHERESGKHGGL